MYDDFFLNASICYYDDLHCDFFFLECYTAAVNSGRGGLTLTLNKLMFSEGLLTRVKRLGANNKRLDKYAVELKVPVRHVHSV